MARSDKFTAAQVIAALDQARGMTTIAARILNCSPNTIRRYIRQYPSVAEAQREAHEAMLDDAERTLYELAVDERNVTALIFLLKTQGKGRGYTQRTELTGADGVPLLSPDTAQLLAARGIDAAEVVREFEALIRARAEGTRGAQ